MSFLVSCLRLTAPASPGLHLLSQAVLLGLMFVIDAGRAWPQSSSGAAVAHQVSIVITNVALMALRDSRPLVLNVAPGTALQQGAAGFNRLSYTVINAPGRTRSIAVQWSATDAVPAGVTLHVLATRVPAGCGIAAGEISLSSSPQTLIRGIPSCATGTGDGGAELRYRATLDDPTRAVEGVRCTVTITYTITDDS